VSRQHVTKSWGAAALAGDRASAKRRLLAPGGKRRVHTQQYPDTEGQVNRPSPPLGSGLRSVQNINAL
jgi:hypothetical protein